MHWPHLRWPKVLIFTAWGTMTGSSQKFGFFFIQEHVNVTQDRQYVGTGNTTSIWYNYILLTPGIHDPNINNLTYAIFIFSTIFSGINNNIYCAITKNGTLFQALYIVMTIYFRTFPRKQNAFSVAAPYF